MDQRLLYVSHLFFPKQNFLSVYPVSALPLLLYLRWQENQKTFFPLLTCQCFTGNHIQPSQRDCISPRNRKLGTGCSDQMGCLLWGGLEGGYVLCGRNMRSQVVIRANDHRSLFMFTKPSLSPRGHMLDYFFPTCLHLGVTN